MKGTVNFFQHPLLPYSGALLATFLITDKAPGPYQLSADFFNTLGPTEEVFVEGAGDVLDPQITFGTALVNYRPQVVLTSPPDQAVFQLPTAIPLAVTANDLDGSIAKVEFFDGPNKIGEADPGQFQFNWNSATPGPHTLTAVATDNLGATATSVPVHIRVLAPPEPYAIFAGEVNLPVGSKVINWGGNDNRVAGKIHSNSDIEVSGNKHIFSHGTLEHVTGITPSPDFKGKVTLDDSRIVPSAVKPYPVSYELAEFAPGGASAIEAQAAGKYFRIQSDTRLAEFITDRSLSEGLYFVEGNVHLSGSGLRGKVTIVATGEIQISSTDTAFEPFSRCLLAFSSKRTAAPDKLAVNFSGSGLNWHGIVFAPNGGIDVSGANNSVVVGSLIGRGVKVVGSNFQLTGVNLESCLPASAPVNSARLAQLIRVRTAFLEASVEGHLLTMSFATEPGQTYTLESAESVVQPAWIGLANFAGDGSVQSFVTPASVSQRFYRLRLEQAPGESPAQPQR